MKKLAIVIVIIILSMFIFCGPNSPLNLDDVKGPTCSQKKHWNFFKKRDRIFFCDFSAIESNSCFYYTQSLY